MQLPRRNFLKNGTLTAVSAGLALSTAGMALGHKLNPHTKGDFKISNMAKGNPKFLFTPATFQQYVGGIFQAPNTWGRKVSLRLDQVNTYRTNENTRLMTRSPRRSDSFSLIFSATERLPQFTTIHKVSHRSLGEFDLFLTPNKTKDGKMTYEAVFNHIR